MMCGRFTTTAAADVLQEEFGLEEVASGFRPSFNVAPTHLVPVVTSRARRALELFSWGLVPSWSPGAQPGQLINARRETLMSRPSFREAFEKRRCLVLADGFYEWKQDIGRKIPMYIRLASGRPFAFAGVWECWLAPDGDVIRSCAIVTTPPNELLAPIHDRMPAILPPAARDAWLDHARFDRDALLDMLAPYPAADMTAHPVSTLVNSPDHDDPRCIEREEPRGTLPLFPDW